MEIDWKLCAGLCLLVGGGLAVVIVLGWLVP